MELTPTITKISTYLQMFLGSIARSGARRLSTVPSNKEAAKAAAAVFGFGTYVLFFYNNSKKSSTLVLDKM